MERKDETKQQIKGFYNPPPGRVNRRTLEAHFAMIIRAIDGEMNKNGLCKPDIPDTKGELKCANCSHFVKNDKDFFCSSCKRLQELIGPFLIDFDDETIIVLVVENILTYLEQEKEKASISITHLAEKELEELKDSEPRDWVLIGWLSNLVDNPLVKPEAICPNTPKQVEYYYRHIENWEKTVVKQTDDRKKTLENRVKKLSSVFFTVKTKVIRALTNIDDVAITSLIAEFYLLETLKEWEDTGVVNTLEEKAFMRTISWYSSVFNIPSDALDLDDTDTDDDEGWGDFFSFLKNKMKTERVKNLIGKSPNPMWDTFLICMNDRFFKSQDKESGIEMFCVTNSVYDEEGDDNKENKQNCDDYQRVSTEEIFMSLPWNEKDLFLIIMEKLDDNLGSLSGYRLYLSTKVRKTL